MKEFKKCLLFLVVFCLGLLTSINVSYAGPLGLFPNFHPGQRVANGVKAVGRGAGRVAHGAGRAVTGRGRSGRSGCAGGSCQQAPAKSPAQAPQQKK